MLPSENKTVLLALKTEQTHLKHVNEETRKSACCGCIPLHAGVVIIAVLELMVAIQTIQLAMWIKDRMEDHNNSIGFQLQIFPVLYFIVCCFGIIGALNEYKGMIGIFRPCFIIGGIFLIPSLVFALQGFAFFQVLNDLLFPLTLLIIALRIYLAKMVKKYYNMMNIKMIK